MLVFRETGSIGVADAFGAGTLNLDLCFFGRLESDCWPWPSGRGYFLGRPRPRFTAVSSELMPEIPTLAGFATDPTTFF